MAVGEETRFALGLLAAIIVVSLFGFALHFASDSEPTQEKRAQATRIKSEQPRISRPAETTRVSRHSKSAPQPVATTAQMALSLTPEPSESRLDQAALVVDPVPVEFLNSSIIALKSPDVVEKYRNRVARKDRFMDRLEAIVTNAAPKSNDIQYPLSMDFTARSQSTRLSYNAEHSTEWIEAVFNTAISSSIRDVLVDVRLIDSSGMEGKRIALFFASVQKHEGKRRFAMEDDAVKHTAIMRIYAVSDELPQLGKVQLSPNDLVIR